MVLQFVTKKTKMMTNIYIYVYFSSSHPNCVSFISSRRPNYNSGRFFLLCSLTLFTFPLSTVPFSKWDFVVTKSHHSNVFINIYEEVRGRPVEVFCFHLSACCNYTTECERHRERKRERFLNDFFEWHTPSSTNQTICQHLPSILNITNVLHVEAHYWNTC